MYVEPPGGRRRRDWIFLSAYVPGLRYDPLPAGAAKRIPPAPTLVFEMHYTPNGSAQQDKTEIGLLFADVDKSRKSRSDHQRDWQHGLRNSARAKRTTWSPATSQPIGKDLTLLSLSPHMHLRGKAFRYELVLPTGEREVLLDVPAYDFNWQTRYRLAEPRQLPVGSVIFCRAVFDNSKDNLANPDPTKIGPLGRSVVGRNDARLLRRDPAPRRPTRATTTKPVNTGLDIVGMFDAADADHNDGLNETEASGHELLTKHFAAIDQDDDELLQLGEILAAVRLMANRR